MARDLDLDRSPRRQSAAGRLLDRIVSHGTSALLLSMLAVAVVLVLLGGFIRHISHADEIGPSESVWQSFERMLDLGTLAEDTTWPARFTGLVLVVVGVIMAAVIVAAVVTVLQDTLERVHEGHVEFPWKPDVAILGWSDQVPTILNELARAEEHQARRVAVVGTPRRADMEERVRRECRAAALLGTIVECRSGDCTDPLVLQEARVHEATGVVILGEHAADDDSATVKAVFAALQAGVDPDQVTLAVEVCGPDATAAVRLVTKGRAVPVSSNEIISLVFAQAVRARGMSRLMHELTSYDGSEIYSEPIPESWAGRPFRDVALGALHCAPIGLQSADGVRILPLMTAPIEAGDELIFISPGRRALELSPDVEPIDTQPPAPASWSTEHLLVIGWSSLAAETITHLHGFLSDESTITVCANDRVMVEDDRRSLETCAHVTTTFVDASPNAWTKRVGALLDEHVYDAVAILPHRGDLTAGQADADTLVMMAFVQHRFGELGREARIVAELRETRSAQLAAMLNPDDIVLSDAISASLISQMVDRPQLDAVFADLLDYRGAAIFIHPPRRWSTNRAPSYGELIPLIIAAGELPIGLRDGQAIRLCPDRSAPLEPGTDVIVIGAALDYGSEGGGGSISTLARSS